MVGHLALLFISLALGERASASLSLPAQLNPNNCPPDFKEHPLILVSLDGFRADYLARGFTPNINSLGDAGVKAPYMKPSFPSSTFPNHYTIVTGMYPSAHGIVHNRFYDPDLDDEYHRGSFESYDLKWWGGEPIWRTATKNGKIAASYFWVGSEVRGLEPTPGYWFKFNFSTPFKTRVDQVLSWVELPVDKRPSVMTLYLHEPDRQGHNFGPYSTQVDEALQEVDVEIGRLIQGLQDRELLDCVNILLVADHGMAEAGETRVVELKKYIPDIASTTRYWDGIFARFNPNNKTEEATLSYMEKLACKTPEMRVYHKRQLPVRWHMSFQSRVEDIVLDLDQGFQVAIKPTYEADAGDHGYDNYFSVMNALFIGHGPDLKRGTEVEAFQNIELYNLMCQLLKIEPAPNNGTWGALHHLLSHPPPAPARKLEKIPKISILPKNSENYQTALTSTTCPVVVSTFNNVLDKLYTSQYLGVVHMTKNLPWGIPKHGDFHKHIRILVHSDHITGYSTVLNQPMWTSFSITEPRPIVRDSSSDWVPDFRLSTEHGNNVCSSHELLKTYGLTWEPLFHPQFSQKGKSEMSWLTSNAMPMSQELLQRWKFIRILLADWAKFYKAVNVVMGPVFDFDSDTFVDDIVKNGTFEQLAVPTHMFIVVTRCLTKIRVPHLKMCPTNKVDVMSFILPQSLIVSNCMPNLRYVQEFSAKLKDVEMITGLDFFPWMSYYDKVKLLTRIHSNIWTYETWANRIRSDLFGLKKK